MVPEISEEEAGFQLLPSGLSVQKAMGEAVGHLSFCHRINNKPKRMELYLKTGNTDKARSVFPLWGGELHIAYIWESKSTADNCGEQNFSSS